MCVCVLPCVCVRGVTVLPEVCVCVRGVTGVCV